MNDFRHSIDLDRQSTWTKKGQQVTGTNKERMEAGLAPVGIDGKPVNLHHMTQRQNGAIAEVGQTFHQQNTKVIHINSGSGIPSGINRNQFNQWKEKYWIERAKDFK